MYFCAHNSLLLSLVFFYLRRSRSDCPICQESLTLAIIQQLDCGHRYHRKCVADCLTNGYTWCSLCRKPMKVD